MTRHFFIFQTGIGRAIAIKLAECGAQVVGISRTKEDLDSLEREVNTVESATKA